MVWIAFLAVAVACVAATVSFLTRDLRARRAIRKLPTTGLGEVVDRSPVKVIGKLLLGGPPLEAPVSRRPCAYYHVWHEEVVFDNIQGTRHRRWVDAGEEEDVTDFLLTDGKVTALVKTRGHDWPEVHLRAEAYQEQVATDQQTRTREAILDADRTVCVIGFASFEPMEAPVAGAAPTGLYRDGPRPQLVIRATRNVPLSISDEV